MKRINLNLDHALNEKLKILFKLGFSFEENSSGTDKNRLLESTAIYDFSDKIQFKLLYKTVDYYDSFHRGSDSLKLDCRLLIDASQLFSFNLNLYEIRNDYDYIPLTMSFTYNRKMEIPVYRITRQGKLEGYVLNKLNNEPVSDVLVRLGPYVSISDIYGRYQFNGLDFGDYQLYINTSYSNTELVYEKTQPLNINLSEYKTAERNLYLYPEAYISGNLLKYHFERNFVGDGSDSVLSAAYVRPEALSDIIITLQNGDDIRKTVSDVYGNFTFPALYPGKWNLIIENESLPFDHFVNKNNINIDVESAYQYNFDFKILPEIKSIHFIDSGVIETDSIGE